MQSKDIRETFMNFFNEKLHKIVDSAPIVVKDDPTLMFTNAGMNQFKDFFLGNKEPDVPRVADTQKCLRVSGKHNDLEEVGLDTYHHTMFEMLGNWSFGDYFKKEAIEWAWELLTKVYKIKEEDLYVTIFEGDATDGVEEDAEAIEFWKQVGVPTERILKFDKKDNFWEMGASGPCGPCSEIHIDLRDESEKVKVPADQLVNMDHPQVIEIWNLVFIQYNRDAKGVLSPLPNKHIDTGMGLERLAMVLQGKQSNYDTDVFQPLINTVSGLCGIKYGTDEKTDIALRVIADHVRAVAFSIADGQLPSNTGAGYVIRRILRRAVRYGYTFLGIEEPFLYRLIPLLSEQFDNVFPELKGQHDFIGKVIKEEESNFLNTLGSGLKRFDQIDTTKTNGVIPGTDAFELYDTFGFPIDLTRLLATEKNLQLDEEGFEKALAEQKARSRADAAVEQGDWEVIKEDDVEEFIGYDYLETELRITRHRKVKVKNKDLYHLVFNYTPFYPEGGGQVGDTGYIEANGQKVSIIDTKKENDLIVHYAKELPKEPSAVFKAVVNSGKRDNTAKNHTATHLLHQALREVLGDHVQQKGSLVNDNHLRFDFSHFAKMTDEEVAEVEQIVNERIQLNFSLEENRAVPFVKAREMGAMALFGEKYGEVVRTIKFGDSVELCGGTHVQATGEIGLFKISHETSVAAGIRRIEAITGQGALGLFSQLVNERHQIMEITKNNKDSVKGVQSLFDENNKLRKELEQLTLAQANQVKLQLKNNIESVNGINYIAGTVDINSGDAIKKLIFDLRNEVDNLFLVLGASVNGKASLSLGFSDNLVQDKDLNAGQLIRELAKDIKGGGGGQPFYANAGGKDPEGFPKVFAKTKELVNSL